MYSLADDVEELGAHDSAISLYFYTIKQTVTFLLILHVAATAA